MGKSMAADLAVAYKGGRRESGRMPRLRKAKMKLTHGAGESIKAIFGKIVPALFRARGTEILAIGTDMQTASIYRKCIVAKFNPQSGIFEKISEGNFLVIGEGTSIMGAKGPQVRIISLKHTQPGQTGYSLTRFFLNGSIKVAKSKGISMIGIRAANSGLRDFYSSLGFVFANPEKPNEGLFRL